MVYERIIIVVLVVLLAAAVLLPRPGSSGGSGTAVPDVLTVIHQRKSVRNYTAEPVAEQELDQLVRAGFAAPSARNLQPWEFYVVTDRGTLDGLAAALPYGKMLAKAQAAIVVCGNSREFGEGATREMWVQDCSAATENILLAAEGIGLGAVWIGVYPYAPRVEAVSKALKLPEEFIPLNVISIGRPDGKDMPKKKYRESKVHRIPPRQ